MNNIPVAIPFHSPKAVEYVSEAVKNNEISGLFGKNIEKFELMFASFIGTKYAVSCSSGTSALHLAMAASGIKKGDEVLVSSFTNMATFFAVMYCGAKPIPVDIDLNTYNIDVDDLKKKISTRTIAILVVHLFGQPCRLSEIVDIANQNDLLLFEDCAESHGAEYNGKQTGSFGVAGCFSFFGNKIVNTGEGGIVTTNDENLANKMKSMRSLSFGDVEKFIHKDIGFNYRMNNISASLGVSQMEIVSDLINMKLEMGRNYDLLLKDNEHLTIPVIQPNTKNVYWMYLIKLLGNLRNKRKQIIDDLLSIGIEVRPGFASYTIQPFCNDEDRINYPCQNAESVSFNTLYLPSSHDIDLETQKYVCSRLSKILLRHK